MQRIASAPTAALSTIYHLVQREDENQWHVTFHDGKLLSRWDTELEAKSQGERLGYEHRRRGERVELLIHRRDGSVERRSNDILLRDR